MIHPQVAVTMKAFPSHSPTERRWQSYIIFLPSTDCAATTPSANFARSRLMSPEMCSEAASTCMERRHTAVAVEVDRDGGRPARELVSDDDLHHLVVAQATVVALARAAGHRERAGADVPRRHVPRPRREAARASESLSRLSTAVFMSSMTAEGGRRRVWMMLGRIESRCSGRV